MTGARPKINGAMYSLYVAGGRPAALAASMADLVAKMTPMAPIAPAAPARPLNVRPVADDHRGNESVADLGHRADEFHVRGLEHGVRPLNEGDESARFDHSNCLSHSFIFG